MAGMSFCIENGFLGSVQILKTVSSTIQMSLTSIPIRMWLMRSIAAGLSEQTDFIVHLKWHLMTRSGRRLSDRDYDSTQEEEEVDEFDLWPFAESRRLSTSDTSNSSLTTTTTLPVVSVEFESILYGGITEQDAVDRVLGLAVPGPGQLAMFAMMSSAAGINISDVTITVAPQIIEGRAVVRDQDGVMLRPTITTTTTTTIASTTTTTTTSGPGFWTDDVIWGSIGGGAGLVFMLAVCIAIFFEAQFAACFSACCRCCGRRKKKSRVHPHKLPPPVSMEAERPGALKVYEEKPDALQVWSTPSRSEADKAPPRFQGGWE